MDLSFPRLLLIPRTEWTAKEMLGDVYGVWLVYTLFSLTERERKRRKEVERSWCQRKPICFQTALRTISSSRNFLLPPFYLG